MLKDIQDILKHCELCKKHTSTPLPSKSVIPYDEGKPFSQWAINIIGPMPSNKQDKKFIINTCEIPSLNTIPSQYLINGITYVRSNELSQLNYQFLSQWLSVQNMPTTGNHQIDDLI